MPPATTPSSTVKGTHQVPSSNPPETAVALGLTDPEPPPPAEVPPPPNPPLFKESRRRRNASEQDEPGWPPVSEADGSEPPTSTPTDPISSPGSTDRVPAADPGPLRDLPELRDGIAQVVHAVGDELNDRVAPGTELFLTDPQDEQGFAKPVSRLVMRRMPAELGAGNPDFVDAVSALIVLTRYAVKQLNLMRAMRREQRAAAAAGQVPYGTPPIDEPAAA